MRGSTRGSAMSDAGSNAPPIPKTVPRDVTADVRLWSGTWRRLAHNRAARRAALLVATLLAVSIIGPWIRPYGIETVDWSLSPLSTPPSIATGHWFGTDANGRDLFVRVWVGTQVSLAIALLATAVSMLIGVTWGATAGYV